ncbi:uncharacterized protein PHALS_00429 [Plasmopara halstedii]|uniref:Uncharacterized protein n=1 Tax=Plasmopara halstedii TaxID=4781 RepID=A0A0P1A7W3_PLAHL|nr:uncharacterized protein PHALS_00429 [Plasmopara halstedii]CEG36111.1 hypothetical protein PHALS_00429 [Plasmopara halstedii]|eukprot:XP_024572480.1 hypothetical protein PHALS_00429 [Plasmopara halstedii]
MYVRKKVFRATAGITIEQQLQMTSQLQAQGDDVLNTILQMEKISKNQKETTQANALKEHSRLKKLEEKCSKELESLLLRMYNEASAAPDSMRMAQHTTSNESLDYNNQDNNEDECRDDLTKGSTMHGLSSMVYATEIEDLIRTEQLNRVALMNQISSEREQRAALKHFLMASFHERDNKKGDNQCLSETSQENVSQLINDAIIGRQMLEVTMEEKLQSCEKDFNAFYQKLLTSLRDVSDRILSDQEHKIAALVEAAGGNKCSDEMLRLEMLNEFRDLFTQVQKDLVQYEQEFITAASASDAAGSIEAATSLCGGWSDADENRFLSALLSYKKKSGRKHPQLLYDQVALVLPKVSLEEVKKHVKFHQHLQFYQEKRKDRQREFQRKLKKQQSRATTKFRKEVERNEETLRKFEQVKKMQQQCEWQRDQVSQWRVTKEAKERIEKQQLEIEQLLEYQKRQEEEQLKRRKQDQQKLAIDEYRNDKRLQQMAKEKFAMEEEQKRLDERVLKSAVDAERVKFRHDAFQRKLNHLKQEELIKIQHEDQRLAALNALKKETPYAQSIVNITPNPDRTRQETIAFRANVVAAQEGLSITETGLFPMNGYDCEALFKNARFKLGIALRNAGLNSSEYARQALANVKICNAGSYRNHIAEPTKLW